MKNVTLAVLALMAFAPAAGASNFVYLAQFRALDMVARATDGTGQSNTPFLDSAASFGPYVITKNVSSARSGASSTLTCEHSSSLGPREINVSMASFGSAERENPLTESSMVFNHNVFDVVVNATQPTSMLIEGRSLHLPGPTNGIAEVIIRENISKILFVGGDFNGNLGGILQLRTGVNYRIGAGADIAVFSGPKVSNAEGEARLDFHVELGAVVADSFTVSQGLLFGGTFDSLHYRDEDAISILNDESAPNAEIDIEATSPTMAPTTLRINWRSRATREDLSEFTYLFNSTTSGFQLVQTRATSRDYVEDQFVASTPNAYVSLDGRLRARVVVIPQTDLETSDGWAYQLDCLRWNIH